LSTAKAVGIARRVGYLLIMSSLDQADVPTDDWAATMEGRVLAAASPLAAAMGWNRRLVAAAASEAGLSPADAALLFPDGARDLAALLFRRHDAAALAALSGIDPAGLKVRERITKAVQARIDAAMADEGATRKAGGFLALPLNAPLALSLGWATADALWRWAGDTATDENHYSKRVILAAVLASTMAARLSGGAERAEAYLKARIDNVMAFETWKSKRPTPVALARDAAALLGRLRYGTAR
jgi:ubiquinone biosynthesis protein COQ9